MAYQWRLCVAGIFARFLAFELLPGAGSSATVLGL